MVNGIIFQRKNSNEYKGVDGDNWYLNDIYQNTLGECFDDKIEKAWYDSEYVDVCNDIELIKNYVVLSQKNHIDFRVLLCETTRQYPKMINNFNRITFIGYDYAYSGGSYYSAVLNDICSRRIGEFANIKLNSYGLFNELTDVNEFIVKRNYLIKENRNYSFECGDFIIYKLYEIEIGEIIIG